jgi:transcriptional regulator of heat shock response
MILLLFNLNLNHLQNIQNQLKQRFKMTSLKQLSHYLEMKITITFDKLIFTQSIYLKKVLNQFEMKNCRSVSTSMKSEMINSLMSAIDEADQATIK